MLVEADHIRHLRRFAHSHSRTPGLFFLSPVWSSCVHNQTLRKEKLARRTPKNLSLRSCSELEHAFQKARSHLAAWLQVQLTSPVSSLLRRAGAFQCTEHCRGAWITRAKSSDQMVGLPTQWSKPYSPTSLKRFGLKTLRLNSPRSVAAAFVPLNAISAANENGPAMRSRSSLLKSSVGTPCGTSRSFPNGSRRPF